MSDSIRVAIAEDSAILRDGLVQLLADRGFEITGAFSDAAGLIESIATDPSDPNKTYQNAASALLAEIRKRSGMNKSLRGPFHPLEH